MCPSQNNFLDLPLTLVAASEVLIADQRSAVANFTNVIVKMFSVRDFYTKDQLVCCKYVEIPSFNFTVPSPFNSKVLST